MKAEDPASLAVRGEWTTCALAIFVSTVAWWSLLGWDTKKTLGSDGYLHGPYDAWQVAGLVIVLALLAAWLGHRGSLIAAPAAAALALAVCFGISAHFDSEDDGSWPIGSFFLAVGAFVGVSLAAFVAQLLERQVARRR